MKTKMGERKKKTATRDVGKKGLEKQTERKQDERMRDWKRTKKTKERRKG